MTGAAGGLRIVRLANFVTARSGGLRTAVTRLAARPEADRRRVARARAEEFGWSAAVTGFLRVHDANTPRGTPSEVGYRTA
ncbi:hypothetical protein JOD64_003992 [Micromonospora luteifusca]|uniref:Uncharacterized protein n=1 Tax=Micromonospora luteifusca TaxID=709860 RepID=A0ABS2LX58_9ACTN|nr:hypothetical protein [Micromonospora luteifusca]MBM7492770.1 hypothetical protein [Micromonospora luteifusca]